MRNRFMYLTRLFVLSFIVAFFTIKCEKPIPISGLSNDLFLNPPTENRPLALWPWLNGYVDTTKLVYELEEMKSKGMRGVVIWDIGSLADREKLIPDGPAFLGTESLGYISLALKTSNRLGLDLGMVASSSWNAGGEWVEPTNSGMQLLSTSQAVKGPSKQRIVLEKPTSKSGEAKSYTTTSMPISSPLP